MNLDQLLEQAYEHYENQLDGDGSVPIMVSVENKLHRVTNVIVEWDDLGTAKLIFCAVGD